jgi:hypothetical protein
MVIAGQEDESASRQCKQPFSTCVSSLMHYTAVRNTGRAAILLAQLTQPKVKGQCSTPGDHQSLAVDFVVLVELQLALNDAVVHAVVELARNLRVGSDEQHGLAQVDLKKGVRAE